MAMRLFLIYVLVEVAAVAALASAVGLGSTLLILVGVFALGVVLAGSQARRQLQRLRTGLNAPRATLTDSAAIALGTVLALVPGLVTSVLGLLLLAPPTRAVLRPVAGALLARRFAGVTVVTGPAARGAGPVVDGEVVSSNVVDNRTGSDTTPAATTPRQLPPSARPGSAR